PRPTSREPYGPAILQRRIRMCDRMRCVLASAVAAAVLAAGCEGKPSSGGAAPRKGAAEARKGHEHPDKGPHGGPLAEWGEEEYHAEFTGERGKKQATVYILDDQIKRAKPIKAETITLTLTSVTPAVQIALKAEPQPKDPAGKSSRFVGSHDELAKEGPFKG